MTSAPTRYTDPRAHDLRAVYLATYPAAEIPVPVESIAEDLLGLRIEERDLGTLRLIVRQWASGERPLATHDREVLKRALKAFRQRLKLARLDAESTVGRGPMSSGRESSIVGVRAPDQYPQEVWDELVRQKRLRAAPHGVYELPPE